MWAQLVTIIWAQYRSMWNRLPRKRLGHVLTSLLVLLWYGLYAGLAVELAIILPLLPLFLLREWLPAILLGIFLYWQLIPLFTFSTGWSLQLEKLQIYPISEAGLFWMEVLLRFTNSPEMILVTLGVLAGLMRHPHLHAASALFLVLYVPFNLLLSLTIREILIQAFHHNRRRELLALLVISIAVAPQFLLQIFLRSDMRTRLLVFAHLKLAPWQQIAQLSAGPFSWTTLVLLCLWIGAVYLVARWQFHKALSVEDNFSAGTRRIIAERRLRFGSGFIDRFLRDPLGAIVQKELQSLPRMPRFRVMFAMACFFGVLVFLPASINTHRHGTSFMSDHFLSIVNLYGLLLLSDILFLNVFGLDRSAVQLYFSAPIHLADVLRAKNLVTILFLSLQSVMALALAAVLRVPITMSSIGEAAGVTSVAAVFCLSVGNLCSIMMSRPVDPKQTLRKQAGGKVQVWFLLCSIGLAIVIGFAFLAGWALQREWVLAAVLLLELGIGIVVYWIASESAVERALLCREQIIDALTRESAPVSIGI
jgi:hypothetical protein